MGVARPSRCGHGLGLVCELGYQGRAHDAVAAERVLETKASGSVTVAYWDFEVYG